MKKHKVIKILCIVIVLFLVIDGIILFLYSSKKDEYAQYFCTKTIEGSEEQYHGTERYKFTFNKGEVDGEVTQIFIFHNKEDYDNFSYERFNSETEPIEIIEMPEFYGKSYVLDITIPAESKKLSLYLEKLKDIGYECQVSE